MAEAFPRVVVIEELESRHKHTVEIAGVRCQTTTTVTGSGSSAPHLSFTVNALNAAEGSFPIIQLEAPISDQQTWNLHSWQDFLTKTIGAGLSAVGEITPAGAERPEAASAEPVPEPTGTGVNQEEPARTDLLGERAGADELPATPEQSPVADGRQDAGLNPEERLALRNIRDRLGSEAAKQVVADELEDPAVGESDGPQQHDGEPEHGQSFP